MRKALAVAAISIACIAVWSAHVPPVLRHWETIGGDSTHYIDCARALRTGRGVMTRTMFGLDAKIWQRLGTFPPGYPVLIALVQSFGVSGRVAGVIVSAGSAALFLGVLAWISLRFLGPRAALGVPLATAVMVPFVRYSLRCYSDSAAMLTATGSLACLLAWSRPGRGARGRRRSMGLLFAAGLLAGVSYAIRYATVSLFLTTGVFLALHLLWYPLRRVFIFGAIWLAGMLITVLPLAVWDVVTFGALIPYNMPPSSQSLWQNLSLLARGWATDLTTSHRVARLLSSPFGVVALCVLAALAAGLWAWRIWRGPVRLYLWRHRAGGLLAMYLVAFTAVTLAAQTKRYVAKPLESRYLYPVYWIVWIGAARVCLCLFRRAGLRPKVSQAATLAVLLAAFGVQVRLTRHYLEHHRPARVGEIFGRPACDFLADHVGDDQIVLADRADVLRVYAGINARFWPPRHFGAAPLSLEAIRQAGERGLLWGVVLTKDKSARSFGEGDSVHEIVERHGTLPGFERIRIDGPALIFRYPTPTGPS